MNSHKLSLSSLAGPAFLILTWHILTVTKLVDPIFLPPVGPTVGAFLQLLISRGLNNLVATLMRALIGTIIATGMGVPLGLILGYYTKLYTYNEMLIDFFRSIPATAFVPLFILVFGLGNLSIISLTVFVCFWTILINSIYGVWNCSKMHIKLAKLYHATSYQLFSQIIFYDALPQIMVGIRLSLSLSLVMVIVAEMIMGAQQGLGRIIYDNYANFHTEQLFAGILLVGLAGFGVNRIALSLERELVHWVGK